MPSEAPLLFLTKGMTIDISSFEISIDEAGKMSSKGPTIHTALDMSPYWLEIAYDNLIETEQTHEKLEAAVKEKKDPLVGELLQKEFVIGMQVVMAGCIAIDSYYASIKKFANIPEEVLSKWRTKPVARYAQIAETLKRVFFMPQDTFQQVRELLKQSFKLRDMAVHPKHGTDVPVLYPEINKITDWRYSAFRYANAKTVVGHSLSLILQTAQQKKDNKKQELITYCDNLVTKIDPTYSKWTKRYGELFKKKI